MERNNIIELVSMKVRGKEVDKRAAQLMTYIRGNEFKNAMDDTIYRSRLLGKSLAKEVETHKSLWRGRLENYITIHDTMLGIQQNTCQIISGEKPKKLRVIEFVPRALPILIQGT